MISCQLCCTDISIQLWWATFLSNNIAFKAQQFAWKDRAPSIWDLLPVPESKLSHYIDLRNVEKAEANQHDEIHTIGIPLHTGIASKALKSQTISKHLKNRWRMMEDDCGWLRNAIALWTATTFWNPTMSWAGSPQLCLSHQPSRAARWCRAGNLSPELRGMVILLYSYIGAFDVSRIQLNLVIGILAANVAYIEGFHNNHIVG